MLEHGGRLRRAAQDYAIALEHWLDVSTGINPEGWPLPAIPREAWTRLPEDEDGLEAAACAYYGCNAVLPVAGSQAAIRMLPTLRAAGRVGVLAPSYAEHARAWAEAGHDVRALPAAALLDTDHDFDVVVLVNPNNPTGECLPAAALLALHARLAARGGWLVVDEAFMDMTPANSLAAFTGRDGLIVLRSPGKFFGLGGARAGFALAAEPLLGELRKRLGPWCVAGPTRWLLCQAFADTGWPAQARTQLAARSARLRTVLQLHGLTASGGTDLFQWIEMDNAKEWHSALAREAVLTRLFVSPPSLRVGLPGDEGGWQQLDMALRNAARRVREEQPPVAPVRPAPESAESIAGPFRSDAGAGPNALPPARAVPSPRTDTTPHPERTAGSAATAGVLMVQGTTSDAGKSTLVTGLCRWLRRRGIAVAPFKPQNMALNSAVTVDGGEIGRAQALQAQAAGVAPHTDFNPILLKPNSDTGAQVIVHGRAIGNLQAAAYHDYKRVAMDAVLASHHRLCTHYRAVVVEGAGSPAEINLRANDIANMGYAEAVDCPVILIADIDRGGVFAHLVGTLALLSASEQARVKGFVINRFRGDIALLQPGLDWLELKTGKPVLGVLPYLQGLHLDAEDALPREHARSGGDTLRVIVPALPRISNHTDFDALRLHPGVAFSYVGPGEPIPAADLIVLPGSKSVRADLAWLRAQGWEAALRKHLRYGGKLIGICGGLQMLGTRIDDPLGIEGPPGSSAGFGLLELETTLEADKQLRNVSGTLRLGDTTSAVAGYEIHCGVSRGATLEQPLLCFDDGRSDGVLSADGQIAGCYLHGLFDTPDSGAALLRWAGLAGAGSVDRNALREQAIDALADAIEQHLDLAALERLLGIDTPAPEASCVR